jgi:hypothetical protein
LENPELKPTLSELSTSEPDHEGSSDIEGEEESLEPTRKRRRNNQESGEPQSKAGHVPNGKDFWSKVDSWFKAQVKERGNDLTGPRWKSYVRFSYPYFLTDK